MGGVDYYELLPMFVTEFGTQQASGDGGNNFIQCRSTRCGGTMNAGGGVVKGSQRDDTPVLITEAEPSYEEQHAARRRKYAIMMSLRFPCLIAAGLSYQIPWLALTFVVLSVPLPWMAVLIANDRPPRKAKKVNRFRPTKNTRALESREHPVIDG